MFRRPSLILIAFLGLSGVTIFMATSTQIGFPYRPKTNVQRVPFLVGISFKFHILNHI